MAKRPVFISKHSNHSFVKEKDITFDWYPGFAVSQKQKSIQSLHENIYEYDDNLKVLEVSSKSTDELGVQLSAFNLQMILPDGKEVSVETAFQASKVFEKGGPFIDLYEKTSKEAKKDERIKSSGKLLSFVFAGETWELEPKTLFYDWLYINALASKKALSKQVLQYNAFTDIEFNPSKSINCQARSVALFVALSQANVLDYVLESIDHYKSVIIELKANKKKNYKKNNNAEQLSLFD